MYLNPLEARGDLEEPVTEALANAFIHVFPAFRITPTPTVE